MFTPFLSPWEAEERRDSERVSWRRPHCAASRGGTRIRETDGHPREALGSEGLSGDRDLGTGAPPSSLGKIPQDSDSPKARAFSVFGTTTDSKHMKRCPVHTHT